MAGPGLGDGHPYENYTTAIYVLEHPPGSISPLYAGRIYSERHLECSTVTSAGPGSSSVAVAALEPAAGAGRGHGTTFSVLLLVDRRPAYNWLLLVILLHVVVFAMSYHY